MHSIIEDMLIYRILLAIVVSVASFGIAVVIDMMFAPVPLVGRFLFQIPLLIILIDESRRWLLANINTFGNKLSVQDINGCFFFAAPLAAFGSLTLFKAFEQLLPRQ
jgi:hypothetical protein